jgi:hypothetical protein
MRIVCGQCHKYFMREEDEYWKRICLNCYKDNKARERRTHQSHNHYRQEHHPRQSRGSIETAMLKRLIYLCHPDKHNNSETSNLATKWLLEQKNK